MIYLLVISTISIAGIFLALVVFLIKYRRREGNEIARDVPVSYLLEGAWTVVPFALVFIAFFLGARAYIDMHTPQAGAESVYVVGKQWMWKIEHENGVSEINQLHVPVGRPVNLIMISQDVVHSFFIPDFRMKYDVLPGRYTRAWFKPERPGSFYLLCTQYCGTDHARMTGLVQVLNKEDYQRWVEQARASHPLADLPEKRGEHLYLTKGCASCHDSAAEGGQGVGPSLRGRFFAGDEERIRDSLLHPNAQVVSGFAPVMPTFAGRLKEEEIIDLIRYLQSRPRREASND
jgi:cytochrome c oxidase subunit 2